MSGTVLTPALQKRIRDAIERAASATQDDFALTERPREPKVAHDGRKNEDLNFGEQTVKVSIVADGRHTRVTLETDEGNEIGEGWALRHKQDERNPTAGVAVAAARAFAAASEYYRGIASRMLGFDVTL